jgi:hypothetical protein
MQNGFNFLLSAATFSNFLEALLTAARPQFTSTCSSRNIGTAAREGHVFRKNWCSGRWRSFVPFGSGCARLGFRHSSLDKLPGAIHGTTILLSSAKQANQMLQFFFDFCGGGDGMRDLGAKHVAIAVPKALDGFFHGFFGQVELRGDVGV